MKKLYVGNLPFGATEEALRIWFQQAGISVEALTVIRDRDTQEPRGFGFIEVADADAQRAITTLNGEAFQDRKLVVNEAKPRHDPGFTRLGLGFHCRRERGGRPWY